MKLIGITGGIGSGKSVITQMFALMGAAVYDSDERAKHLMSTNKEIISDIRTAFGPEAYDKTDKLNRNFLRDIVFKDAAKLKQLNEIVHGAVRKDFFDWSKTRKEQLVLFESAIILNRSWINFFDHMIYVYADESVRIARVQNRDQLTEEMIKKIILTQKPDSELFEDPKVIWIDNSGVELLIPKVWSLYQKLINN